jgi:hypothetical protein
VELCIHSPNTLSWTSLPLLYSQSIVPSLISPNYISHYVISFVHLRYVLTFSYQIVFCFSMTLSGEFSKAETVVNNYFMYLRLRNLWN